MNVLIKTTNVSFGFGRGLVLDNISFEGREGRVYGLFGSNGSGKTTLFNILCGIHRPISGQVCYFGKQPKRIDPMHISRLGGRLARTFQVPVVVDNLSVADNLLLAHRFPSEGFSTLLYRSKNQKQLEDVARLEILRHLDEFELISKRDTLAGSLSYGERRLISILCAVLTRAKILLLDEPFANLNSRNVEKLKVMLRTAVDQQQQMLMLIEHLPDNLVGFADVLFQLHEHKLETYELSTSDAKEMSRIMHSSIFTYE